MPKEYTECVKSEIASGKSKKVAQRICAIRYYKNHGRTPQQDEHASLNEFERGLFLALELLNDNEN